MWKRIGYRTVLYTPIRYFRMSFLQNAPACTGKTKSLFETFRKKLSKYQGGSITCIKDYQLGIAKICIDNPKKRNAISGQMMLDLESIVDDLAKWTEGKGIILYGANGIFCSGGDLNVAHEEGNAEFGFEMSTYMSDVLYNLRMLPLVSVAYIDGLGAVGGGAELVTACDFRLICNQDSKTKIGFIHTKMGIVPAWGGSARLVNIIGRQKALDVILSAKMMNAEETTKIGFTDGIVNNFEEAIEWLSQRIKQDALIVQAAKLHIINASAIDKEISDGESRLFAPLWGGAANKNALQKNIKHNSDNGEN